MNDEIYIGILKVVKPWIIERIHSDRPEATWASKVAVIPGSYPLHWTPKQKFQAIRTTLRGMVIEQEFQGKPVAFDDGKITEFEFSISENEAVLSAVSPAGPRPYQVALDIAVAEAGWSAGIINADGEIWEYMEGRIKVVEGTTI